MSDFSLHSESSLSLLGLVALSGHLALRSKSTLMQTSLELALLRMEITGDAIVPSQISIDTSLMTRETTTKDRRRRRQIDRQRHL